MTDIQGRRALVTGATGGLGRAIAKGLRAEGAEVVLTGRRQDVLDAVARETDAGTAISADLSRREEVERMIEEAGRIDIAVLNAALPASGALEGWDLEGIERVIAVNLTASIEIVRLLLPRFQSDNLGHFVFISSVLGKVGSPKSSLYCATKFALRGFASALRADLRGTNIGCSVVGPGFVRDAGLFADTGVTLPPGVGTVSPEQVSRAVVKAIRTNKADTDVAPLPVKLGAIAGGLAPNISAIVQTKLDRGLSDKIADAQKAKRS